jgi:hypothetical protein
VPGEPRNDLDEGLQWDAVEFDDYEGDRRSLEDTLPERAGDTMSERVGSSSSTAAPNATAKLDEQDGMVGALQYRSTTRQTARASHAERHAGK